MTKLLDLLYQRSHTGNKLHQCNLYDKCFTQNKNLVRHQRTHTVDKIYQCGQCKKCFAKKSNLAMHQKIHTGDRPYQCSQFDKAFSTNMYTCIYQKYRHREMHFLHNMPKIYRTNKPLNHLS